MKIVFTFGLILAVAATAQNTEREGQYWVRSARNPFVSLAPHVQRVEIFTRGHIVVRGVEGNQVQVVVRQKVRAASLEQAARIWGPPPEGVRYGAVGPVLRFEIKPPFSSQVTTELEISVPRRLALVWINNVSGGIEAYDLDGNLRVDTGGGHIIVDRIRGDVRTVSGLGDIRLGTVGGSVECQTGGGTITLLNAAGSANCASGGGDIEVKSVGGPLQVTTEGGNIRVEKAGNSVRAKTMEGQVDVVEARGAVAADSAAGGVQVRGGSAGLNLSAMMGNIVAELLGGKYFANSSLMAGAGDITVMIPQGLGIAVRAQNASGATPRIVSEFPEIQVRSVGFRPPAPMGGGWLGQGSISGGGPVLDLHTNGGVIYLRRVK